MQHSASLVGSAQGRPETVIILGGKGGFAARYRDIARAHGYELEHYEQRIPPSMPQGRDRVALVLVIVSMVSHSLRDQARKLAGPAAPVVYVKRASISAVRDSLRQARGAAGAAERGEIVGRRAA